MPSSQDPTIAVGMEEEPQDKEHQSQPSNVNLKAVEDDQTSSEYSKEEAVDSDSSEDKQRASFDIDLDRELMIVKQQDSKSKLVQQSQ